MRPLKQSVPGPGLREHRIGPLGEKTNLRGWDRVLGAGFGPREVDVWPPEARSEHLGAQMLHKPSQGPADAESYIKSSWLRTTCLGPLCSSNPQGGLFSAEWPISIYGSNRQVYVLALPCFSMSRAVRVLCLRKDN